MIALFGLLAAAVGAYLINRSTVNEAQRRVSLDLRSAWSVVQSELDGLELFLGALSGGKRVQEAFHQPGDQAIRALLDLARQYDDLKRDLWTLYGLLSLGAVAIVLALGFLFSRRLTGSVSRLAQAAAQANLVANIAQSIEKAVGMTRKYLDLPRIEKGELTPNPRPMDMIKDVVAPLLAEFGEAMAAKQVLLCNELPQTVPLTGDRDLLQIVYKNLLDNALKYGRPGGAIRLVFVSEGALLRFEVWNQGENLSEAQLSQVFDKFVRLRRAEGLAQGTGLGLFITRDIVRKHGGEIRAECPGDQWVKFSFTLPAPT